MPVAAVVAGTVVSAVTSKKAAKSQVQSGDQAIAEQQRQYEQTRADQSPYMQAGAAALGRLQDPNAFQASPGYNWVRSEGQRDIGNSFAARGSAGGGNALRALTEFNQNLASQEYGNWFNQQLGIASGGQQATGQVGAFGQRSAENIAQGRYGQGAARASGIAGVGNALVNFGDQYLGLRQAGMGGFKQNSIAPSRYGRARTTPYQDWANQGPKPIVSNDPWARRK